MTDEIYEAKEELKSLRMKRCQMRDIEYEIRITETKATSPRSNTLSAVPTHGGGNHYEHALASYVDEKDELIKKLRSKQLEIEQIENALSVLTDEEREVIDKFYINWTTTSMWDLTDELNCGRTHIYKLRNNALKKYINARGRNANKTRTNCGQNADSSTLYM